MRAESLFFISANNLNIYSLVYTFFLCVNQDQQLRKSLLFFFREKEKKTYFLVEERIAILLFLFLFLLFIAALTASLFFIFIFILRLKRSAKKIFLKVIFVFYFYFLFIPYSEVLLDLFFKNYEIFLCASCPTFWCFLLLE